MTFCSFYCLIQIQWDLDYCKSFHKEILFITFFQQWHSRLTSRNIEITSYFVPLHSRVYKIFSLELEGLIHLHRLIQETEFLPGNLAEL